MKYKYLTFEDRKFIEDKLPYWTKTQIARALGMSYSGFRKELEVNTGENGYNAEEAHALSEKRTREAARKSGGTRIKGTYSEAEFELIKEWVHKNYSIKKICEKTGRSWSCIIGLIRRFGWPQPEKPFFKESEQEHFKF